MKEEKAKIKIKDIMTRKVISASPSAHITQLIDLLVRHHLHIIPIVDKEMKLLGVVTLEDILKIFIPRSFDFMGRSALVEELRIDDLFLEEEATELEKLVIAEDIMNVHVVSVDEDMGLAQAAELMKLHNVHRLPVLKENKLVGIISELDITLTILKQKGIL